MPEERGLYRKMTVRDVLTYLAALKGMKRRAASQEIARWLGIMTLTDWADRKVEELSKGMQQKLQFIATVINDPEFLILDEPFSGLDPVNLDLLEGIMLRMREAGKTVLFSTHVMERAEKLCDFILLINKGKTVFDGTLDQIRSRYKSNAVMVELDGDAGFIRDLPMVKSTTLDGKRLEVALKESADSQDLLRALVGRVRVRSFEEKVPSLHEIFVHLVGGNNE
jgi:ABC-2 type transport system ATP-binding protein